ncbi:hypothetical protein [Streptomyces sp. GMY02]|nr:hypothetical protein [Streptomyces sp. GMY02]
MPSAPHPAPDVLLSGQLGTVLDSSERRWTALDGTEPHRTLP